jgi:hypothetical protein
MMTDDKENNDANLTNNNESAVTQTMGIQSPKRCTNSCKIRDRPQYQQSALKKVTKQVLAQRPIFPGLQHFDPVKQCPVCKAKSHGEVPPHKPHHNKCPLNSKAKGIVKSAESIGVEAEAARSIAKNNQPLPKTATTIELEATE